MKTVNGRTAEFDIDDLFLNRWSPRAMSGEEITEEQLMTLFEAARWAPSSGNTQPWRFIYALKSDPEYQQLFNLLDEGNQEWCKNASALVLTISYHKDRWGDNKTHSFDAGAAWENFALQGSLMGLVVHGMGGLDRQRAKEEYQIPEDYTVEMMIAVGLPGDKSVLSEKNADRENPSPREPLEKFVFKGVFKKD